MAVMQPKYAASTAVTISCNSKATGAARASAAVDNTGNRYMDALLGGAITLQAGTPGSDFCINVYAYGSEDGTNYGDNATGSDADITLRSYTNLKLIACITTPDSGGLTYRMQPVSIAKAFDGILPRKWGIVVENRTNVTFATTGNNNTFSYTGVNLETT